MLGITDWLQITGEDEDDLSEDLSGLPFERMIGFELVRGKDGRGD
jgi:hypothetical protein